MRGSTRTIRHTHIHIPSMRDARAWTEKLLAKEKTTDVALLVIATMLCGWLVYCLYSAFQNYTYLM